MPSSGLLEGLTVFAENPGLVVGRTLVDPSRWRIPVLVSNFGQDAVMVGPFSEVGMVIQVSAIQSVTEDVDRSSHDSESLPVHLPDLLDQMSRDLDENQQHQLAGVLLRYADLFPRPGSTLTGHTDAMVKDVYPLPRIDDTLDMLAGKQWFSTLDLASGYWQVSLSREARAKTAFATHSVLFQFKVMPFGLCNAPATFERLMD